MADLPPFPSQDKLAYRMLELTAICGEFPSHQLARLPESPSYLDTVIRGLKKDRLLRLYYRDKLRGLRLTARAKNALLQSNPERFSFYLTGNTDTNVLKNEPARRLRLHSLAEVYVLMLNSGIEVFRDRKPNLFSPDGGFQTSIRKSCFYSSREIKELGEETIKIRGSRMAGVLLTPDSIYVTYNGAQNFAKWDYRAEQRAKALIKSTLCHDRLSGRYKVDRLRGLLINQDMDFLYELLSTANSGSRCFFLLDGNYEHFYYLTGDPQGEMLLWLLCSPIQQRRLNETLLEDLKPPQKGLPIEHDAVTKNGEPVLFSYLPDLPRLVRFHSALELMEQRGHLICFDFQESAIQNAFGSRFTITTISYEKFERRVFHQQA